MKTPVHMRGCAAKAGNALIAWVFAFEATAFANPEAAMGQKQASAQRRIKQGAEFQAKNDAKFTVRGARISMGEAAYCPNIRSDNGTEPPASKRAPKLLADKENSGPRTAP